MKYFSLLLCIAATSAAYCSEEYKELCKGLFVPTHELYNDGEWEKAYFQYTSLLGSIKQGILPTTHLDRNDLLKAHVNFADVSYAKGATEWNNGNYDEAKQLMLQACDHWSYRLEARQFGRAPLDNEWDGSDITNKRTVVKSERVNDAFGDSFYLTSLLRYLKEKGAYVIFVPQKPLAKLYDKNYLPDALQTQYVDQVAFHEAELPEHDCAIYLWSILKHYLNDETVQQHFPMKPCLSGKPVIENALLYDKLIEKICSLREQFKQDPLLVGMWWRGSANNTSDYGKVDRDLGAHRMLGVVQNLPVLIINLEGLGRIPLSEEEYKKRIENGTLGNSDMIDVTSHPTDNVLNFDAESFDKKVPFADTLGVMQCIKVLRGVLIGCDTGLCNAAAMIEKNEEAYPEQSVLAILNERADHRWGTEKTSPRTWHHSKDVLILQAQSQGQWDLPLAQARKVIKKRIKAMIRDRIVVS